MLNRTSNTPSNLKNGKTNTQLKRVFVARDGTVKCITKKGQVHEHKPTKAHDFSTLENELVENINLQNSKAQRKADLERRIKSMYSDMESLVCLVQPKRTTTHIVRGKIAFASIRHDRNTIVTESGFVSNISSESLESKADLYFIENQMSVRCLAHGATFVAFVSEENELFVQGQFGKKYNAYSHIPLDTTEIWSQIYAGDSTIVLLSNAKEAHILGLNFVSTTNLSFSLELQRINLKNHSISTLSIGKEHILFLTEEGIVVGAGSNTFSQIGPKDTDGFYVLNDKRYTGISTGSYCSAVLDENGNVYVWGRIGSNNCSITEPYLLRSNCSAVYILTTRVFVQVDQQLWIYKLEELFNESYAPLPDLKLSSFDKIYFTSGDCLILVIDSKENLIRHYAMSHLHEPLKSLIEDGSGITGLESQCGSTLLHYAAYCGDATMLEYLLEQATWDVGKKNVFGKGPLYYALIAKNVACLKLLFYVGHPLAYQARDLLEDAFLSKDIEIINLFIRESHFGNIVSEVENCLNKVRFCIPEDIFHQIEELIYTYSNHKFKMSHIKHTFEEVRRYPFLWFMRKDMPLKDALDRHFKTKSIFVRSLNWYLLHSYIDSYKSFIFLVTPNSAGNVLLEWITYAMKLKKPIFTLIINPEEVRNRLTPKYYNLLPRPHVFDTTKINDIFYLDENSIAEFTKSYHHLLNNDYLFDPKQTEVSISDPTIFDYGKSQVVRHPTNHINLYFTAVKGNLEDEYKLIVDNVFPALCARFKNTLTISLMYIQQTTAYEGFNLLERFKAIENSYPHVIVLLGEMYGPIDYFNVVQTLENEFLAVKDAGYDWIVDFQGKSALDIESSYILQLDQKYGNYDINHFYKRDPSFLATFKKHKVPKEFVAETTISETGRDRLWKKVSESNSRSTIYKKDHLEEPLLSEWTNHFNDYIEKNKRFMKSATICKEQQLYSQKFLDNHIYIQDAHLMNKVANFFYREEQICCIQGPKKSGKSTLLHNIKEYIGRLNGYCVIMLHTFFKGLSYDELVSSFILHLNYVLKDFMEYNTEGTPISGKYPVDLHGRIIIILDNTHLVLTKYFCNLVNILSECPFKIIFSSNVKSLIPCHTIQLDSVPSSTSQQVLEVARETVNSEFKHLIDNIQQFKDLNLIQKLIRCIEMLEDCNFYTIQTTSDLFEFAISKLKEKYTPSSVDGIVKVLRNSEQVVKQYEFLPHCRLEEFHDIMKELSGFVDEILGTYRLNL